MRHTNTIIGLLAAGLLWTTGCLLSPQPEPPDVNENSNNRNDGDGVDPGPGDAGVDGAWTGDAGGESDADASAHQDANYCDDSFTGSCDGLTDGAPCPCELDGDVATPPCDAGPSAFDYADGLVMPKLPSEEWEPTIDSDTILF